MLRCYVGQEIELKHNIWIHNEQLVQRLHQDTADEVVLFDGQRDDRLYRVDELTDREAHLRYITDYARKVPEREISLLVPCGDQVFMESMVVYSVQHGVSHLVPYYIDDTMRPELTMDRLHDRVVRDTEASERSDLLALREPMTLETAVQELRAKTARIFVGTNESVQAVVLPAADVALAAVVPPQDGWDTREKQLFTEVGACFVVLDRQLGPLDAAVAMMGSLDVASWQKT